MKFKVHSCTPVSVSVDATTAQGMKVEGKMPGLNVELLPVDDGGKTVTLEVTAQNWAGMDPKEMFAVGNVVEMGFTLSQKAEPKT